MRKKRVDKFKKLRRKRYKKVLLYLFVLPAISIFLGYIIRTVFILPLMKVK
ncbi:hypothetical protein [Acetivibrio saccincola]|jgi:hypothetical protein|uniref:Uncharacterized protein n=1 Tax=Acetivibrio saccincola TaxID=1677857 RepID=A0A2K9ENY4_9FIRM|nr:hypothetical protein [Acetivibrio saccincola]AUG57200.1 hypothetical protein HVS_06370 [Acetivibrio saccincola]